MDGSQDFTASRLSFEVTGEGVAIDPATGHLSLDTDGLRTGIVVTVTATNALGGTVSRMRLTLATDADTAPVLVAGPVLAGAAGGKAVVGTPVTLDPGTWDGVPAPELAIAWLLDGVGVAGAVGTSYTPAAADEGKSLSARVTATNNAGTASAETATVAIVHAAPTVAAPLADVAVDAGAAPVAVAAAAAFAGAALTFAVSGRGAVIDSTTGLVTIATGELLDGERITVTATNSGGSAQADFTATVRATLPVAHRQPVLAVASAGAKGIVGTALALDPGDWSGVPVPGLAFAWLRGGAVIAGATGTSYTPVPADDGKSLSARVTATNLAGSAAAETAPVAVAYAAPTVVAPLADVGLVVGGTAVVVVAAAAFAGSALVFTVAGGGATVDAQGQVSVPATAVGSATVTVTATNSGGSAKVSFKATVSLGIVLPVLLVAPVLAGSGRIGTPVTTTTGSWSGAPATSVEWLIGGVAVAGATGTSYAPLPAHDGKTLSARIKATNGAGSVTTVTAALAVTYAPPVAKGGLHEVIADLGDDIPIVAAGADFTGENLAFAVTGAGATIDAKTGAVSIPTDAAVQATVTVTATNSGGSASSSFQVTVEAEDIPFALEADDITVATSIWRPGTQETWFTPVVRFPGLAGETVHAIEWTTSSKASIPDSEYEVVTKVGPNSYQLYMRDTAKNVPGAAPRVDYSVFKLDETKRREALRFRWRRSAEGEWSAPSPALSVPAAVATPTGWKKRWIPMVTRAKEGYEAKIIDGPGLQFLRSFATTPANPELILGAMDQNFPWQSDDFGKSFYTPSWSGLWGGREGISAWIDPEDANRRILAYAVQVPLTAQRPLAGLYLSTDGGKTCAQVLSVPLTRGTQNIRHDLQLVAHAPGGTAATRTVYYMQISGTADSADVATIQLWRSTDGGGTWAKRGGTLAPATYASGDNGAFGLLVAPNGDLYQYGRMGAWRSPAGTNVGTSWTKLSSLPSGQVHCMQVTSTGVVWAAVQDNGLYKATDGVTFAKNAAFGTTDIRIFAISPADDAYMVAAKVGTIHPFYSTNGGNTWTQGTSHPRLGQDDNAHTVGNKDHYGIVPKQGDREVWFFHLGQHYGVSTDHGQNIYAAGTLFDGSHTRGSMGFHPSNWLNMCMAQQDRATMTTQTGGDYWLEDDIGNPKTGKGLAIATAANYDTYISGAGAFIHGSGRIVTHQGRATGQRVAVIMDQNVGGLSGVYVTSAVSGLTDQAALDPNSANRGFGGKYRITSLDAASPSGVVFAEMARHFVGLTGYGGSTVIYGVDNTNDRNIYRSDSATPGASWSLWKTTSQSFRPSDKRPAFAVCPHHAARVYAVSGDGYLVRIVGTSNPAETTIFDARAYLPAGHPAYQCNSVAVDPFDENLGYVSLYMWGVPCVFRTRNLTAANPTWESIATGDEDGLPHLDLELNIHPLTSDLLACGSHGTYVCKPPSGHQATYGLANSLWDRIAAYMAIAQ